MDRPESSQLHVRRGGHGEQQPPLHRASRPALLVVVVVLMALGVFADTAGAHATLLEMVPGSEETLDGAPGEVRLTFSEGVSVSPDSIRVFDPAARELGGVAATNDGETVLVADLPTLEARGSYTVAWKVVSADGHPIRGAYLFHLGEATLSEPVDAGGAASSLPSDVFRAVGAVLALAGLVLCLGAAALGPRRVDVPRWWAMRWVPVVAGTTLLLGGAVVAVGSSLSRSFQVAMSTTSGTMAFVAVVLAFSGLIVSLQRLHPGVELAVVVLATGAVALQGHAVSLSPVALSAVATLVHVLAAVLWAAALFRLEHRSRTADAGQLVDDVVRFSPWGVGMVVALAGTGVVLLVDRVGVAELLSSNYGRVGLVKVLALVVAVVLAWRNRRVALGAASAGISGRPEALAGDTSVRSDSHEGRLVASRSGASAIAGDDVDDRGLGAGAGVPGDSVAQGSRPDDAPTAAVGGAIRRGIRLEMAALALALIAGAALAQIPPPTGSDGSTGGDGLFAERADFGDGEVEITLEPGKRGVNEVHVVALGPDGRLMVDAAELDVAFELPSEDVGPIQADMQVVTAGHSLTYVRLPLEGTWTATVNSRIDEFTELTAQFEVSIAG